MRGQTSHLPQTQRDIFNLTRSLEVAQQVYLQLLGRAQELRVLRASTVGSVRIVDPAWATDERVNFGLGRSLAIALVSGLIIGTLVTLIRRSLRRGLRGIDAIEELGLPVFATIPYSPSAQTSRKRGKLTVLAQTHPGDPAVEALRMLRTTLHFGLRGARSRSLLLTSAAPAAGKSFTAINLAVIAAEAGQSVCLIDADLRRGYLRRYLSGSRTPEGLAELLAGKVKLENVLLHGSTPGLSLIPSGAFPPNPSELLLRPNFAALLAELGRRFDLVLVDSPPALTVTDALILGQHIGSVFLVARHLKTPAAQLAAVRRRFETAGAEVTGAILNGYRPEHGQAADAYASAYHYPSANARL